jgi:hypothetical protein
VVASASKVTAKKGASSPTLPAADKSNDKTGLRVGVVVAAASLAGAVAFHHFVMVPQAQAVGMGVGLGLGLLSGGSSGSVDFSGLSSGAAVSSPLHLEYSVKGMSVSPASEGIQAGTGHFHLLIDLPSAPEGEPIPFDDSHKHYGKGQTSDDVTLAPGKHQLTLQFADAKHQSYGPAFAKTVSVIVK